MSIAYDPGNAAVAIRAVRWLLFISLTGASLQQLYNHKAFSSQGLFAWRLMKYAYPLPLFEGRAFNVIFGRAGFVILNLLRLTLIGLTITGPRPLLMTALFLVNALIYLRSFLSTSAADQVNSILLFYLLVCAWFPTTGVLSLCLCFIAVQTVICYVVNGLLKAMAPAWSDGSGFKGVLQTENYSRRGIAAMVGRTGQWPLRLVGWLVIVWELSAILAPFLPRELLFVWLGMGICFHLTIALVMGLNTFFWTFVSTYPAIIFLQTIIPN
jgi:hypothetical protein